MNVPLRWLVGRHDLGLRVRVGGDRLDRMITWAHATDLADPVPWLAGGELILTTGLALPAEPDRQRAYVHGLTDAGVAALGFGIGLSYEQIPEPVLRSAEETCLPVIEVPFSTSFRDVIIAVAGRVFADDQNTAARSSRAQLSITRGAVRHGPESVVRELAATLGAVVLLESDDGSVIAASSPDANDLPASLAGDTPDSSITYTSTDENGTVIAYPVRVDGRPYGRLLLARQPGPTAADHALISQAISLIVLDRLKPQRLRAAQNRLNSTVFGLALGRAVPPAQTAEQLRDTGLVRSELRVTAYAAPDPRRLLEEIDDLLTARGMPTVAVERDEHVAVLLPGPGTESASALTSELARRCRSVHAGVSEAATADRLPRALHQALTAARAARARRAPLVGFDELAGHALAFDSRTRDALAELAHERLGRLASFDRENGTALLASLRAYLEHSGQWNTASNALGVHRHTLRGRMEQIRDLIDIDIDSAHVKAELLLSLMVWNDEIDTAELCTAKAGHDVQ